MKRFFLRYKVTLGLIIIILTGVILRGWVLLQNKSFWLDEAMIYYFSTKTSVLNLVSGNYYDFAEHPFLNYLLLKFWSLFSINESWLRLMPLTFGLFNIALIYYAGKLIKNPTVGVIASLFFATSVYHIFYSTEIKYYQLTLFMQLLSFIYVLKALKGQKITNWIKIGIFNFFTFIADYSSIWYFFPLYLSLLGYLCFKVIKKQKDSFRFFMSVFISGLITAVLASPWLVKLMMILPESLKRQTYLSIPTFTDVYRVLGAYISFYWMNGVSFSSLQKWYDFMAFLPIIIILVYLLLPKYDFKKIMLGSWVIMPLLVSFLISQEKMIFLHYNLMSISIPLILLLAMVGDGNKKFLSFNIMLYLVLNLISLRSPVMYKDLQNWRGLFLDLDSQKDSKIIFTPEYLRYPFLYYSDLFQSRYSDETMDIQLDASLVKSGNDHDLSSSTCVVTMLDYGKKEDRKEEETLDWYRGNKYLNSSNKFNGHWADIYYECFAEDAIKSL